TTVVPAKAGTHFDLLAKRKWVPAFAGTTSPLPALGPKAARLPPFRCVLLRRNKECPARKPLLPKANVIQQTAPALAPNAPWVVLKFGGTSVSTRPRWENIRRIAAAHRGRG